MNWWKRARVFFSEVRSEMSKVTFPSRDEVVATTIVVIITSFIFAFYLALADVVITKLYEGIFRVLG
jgi:preprotein translocase subunit SecE